MSGFIDGKFESGYLITVKIGSEDLKGVLYQIPINQEQQELQNVPAYNTQKEASTPGIARRKRRKKSEIKKRDPAHPKPNRSGYNFFFAEQHARLKPLYPGKDREISRMIGELWNNLNVPEKMVGNQTIYFISEKGPKIYSSTMQSILVLLRYTLRPFMPLLSNVLVYTLTLMGF